jgi:hypothetical protein
VQRPTEEVKSPAGLKHEEGEIEEQNEEARSEAGVVNEGKKEQEPTEEAQSAVRLKQEDSDEEHNPVIVEFKFSSCKTRLLDEGELSGALHIPMLQDPQSGRFTIPPGITQCKGIVQRKRYNMGWTVEEELITPSFERTQGGPIENFTLGYDLRILQEDDIHARIVLSTAVQEEDYRRTAFQTYPHHNYKDKDLFRQRLNKWEDNAGGMLQVYAEASIENIDDVLHYMSDPEEFMENTTAISDYKIKLCTVLSAHKPNEIAQPKQEPDWGALQQLVMVRFPDKDDSWAKRAVQQYIHFLEIKKQGKDWGSKKFSPSPLIDEIWHAHLSFTDRYQYDMMAFCGHIIEHSPVPGADAWKRYQSAFCAHHIHLRRRNEEIDREFWPRPKAMRKTFVEVNDGDSDDCIRFPPNIQCG